MKCVAIEHPAPVVVPGPIQAVGTFMYQLNANPNEWQTNLWGGSLSPHNGNDPKYLNQAVQLFLTAPALLEELRHTRKLLRNLGFTTGSMDALITLATKPVDHHKE